MRCRSQSKGFTLIEMVIVLAIAALVLAAILLAVGGAQRSQRDTTTKNSAGRVGSALQNYASNHQGTMPAAYTDINAGGANYLMNVFDGQGGSPRHSTVRREKATGTVGREILYSGQAVCNDGIDPDGVLTHYAVDYWVENGSTDVCTDNQ